MTDLTLDVVHVPERSRFEVRQDDGPPAVLSYELEDDAVAFVHTVVPDAMEGQGVGGRLAATGVAWARGEGLRVTPLCSFVRGWLERHPEALEA